MIFNKKRAFFQNKLTESIGKPKDLWKALKALDMPNKVYSCEVKALKINNNEINFCPHEITFFYLYIFLRTKFSPNTFNFNQIES